MIFNELFSKYLIENSIFDEAFITKYLEEAEKNTNPLYYEIIKTKKYSEDKIFKAVASFFHLTFKTIQLSQIDIKRIDEYPRQKLIEYRVCPINEDDNSVTFAVCDPLRIEDLQEFKFFSPKRIETILITNSNMNLLINFIDNKITQRTVMEDFQKEEMKEAKEEAETNIEIDAPIIKLCDTILKDAVNRGASDIHIEPYTDEIVVRYRVDGKLMVIDRIKATLFQAILARYKIMAEMNIAERRVPQDGKIRMAINGNEYDFRVSSIPTIHGEKLVIRIFSLTLRHGDLGALGFNDDERELVLNMITRPHGIILMTGPTGSGKSTSLYAFLRYLNKEDTNIITVEDPVENQIDGINQVQVNAKANLTFGSALRSILRQDPNVIMIGEIRDEETAQIATRAAITGHLVLSTLHTNSACGVASRLINMGVPPYLVADSLLGSISQRLVRKLCPYCKKEHMSTPGENEILGLKTSTKICSPVGCPSCNNTGYSGRLGVFEILVCNDAIRNCIMDENFSTELLQKTADKQKMVSLTENTKMKVLEGLTSVEEYTELLDVIKKGTHDR